MKKLCKLFYKDGTLGKWILYDVETKLVIELKKFEKNGEETRIHLLEQGMLEKGVLELDHCIKVWEVELMLAEVPVIPNLNETYPPLTQPRPNPFGYRAPGVYTYTTDGTGPIVFGSTTGTHASGSFSISNGSSANVTFTLVTSDAVPPDKAAAISDDRHVQFLTSIGRLGLIKDYKREDEDFKEGA